MVGAMMSSMSNDLDRADQLTGRETRATRVAGHERAHWNGGTDRFRLRVPRMGGEWTIGSEYT